MDCVFFDLDGTAADTEVLKAKSLSYAVNEFGVKIDPEFYKTVMGQSWEVVTGSFFKHAGISISLDVFNPIFQEKYKQLIELDLIDKRSVVSFINFLKNKKISVGLVTSASPWMIVKVLSKLNLENKFDTIVSNADTTEHKPHPDAYLIALQRLGIKNNAAIAFEDSNSGFSAATSAGINVYGVKHDFNEQHSFDLCQGTITSFDECMNWTIF